MIKIQNSQLSRIRPTPILADCFKLASPFSKKYQTPAGHCKALILISTGMCFGHFLI